MGRRCRDNAMAESFFATLEYELFDRRRFKTQAEARMTVFRYLEGWYNPHRRHSALGYESPANFEKNHERSTAKSGACQGPAGTATFGEPGLLLPPRASGAAGASDANGCWGQRGNVSTYRSNNAGEAQRS